MEEHQDTPNPNEERADRALTAIRSAAPSEETLTTALARLLANVAHLCDRHQVNLASCHETAENLHRQEVAASDPAAAQPLPQFPLHTEPVEVVTVNHRGQTSRYRASVSDILGEFVEDPDILVPLWGLLVGALISGSASEEPEETPHRTFFVEETERTALARQLMRLRRELLDLGAVDADDLPEPEKGFERFIP